MYKWNDLYKTSFNGSIDVGGEEVITTFSCKSTGRAKAIWDTRELLDIEEPDYQLSQVICDKLISLKQEYEDSLAKSWVAFLETYYPIDNNIITELTGFLKVSIESDVYHILDSNKDSHELTPAQCTKLLKAIMNKRSSINRWYAWCREYVHTETDPLFIIRCNLSSFLFLEGSL